ncbi:MAG: beta-CASP ribonuclease aCPSF1, partial [Candidatus Diapherotrites archaeon]|nr:beta-CASP ribonuclease aCPSF1 [Candidatus Diapherotrites archaeon]
PRNTLIFVGYQGEGSLGRKLQNNVKEIPITGENGRTKNLHINMRIESIEGFSGHSDRSQLVNYLRNLRPKPKRVLVNHGNKHKTIEFSKFVQSKFHINASAPHNLDSIRLT